MRVTNKTVYDSVQLRLEQLTNALKDANEVVTTGKRINRISDDPSGLTQVLNVKSTIGNIGQLDKNMDNGLNWLTGGESSLSNVNDIILDAKLLTIQLINSSNNVAQRVDAADQIDSYIDEVMSIANLQINGSYIFGGTRIGEKPMVFDDETNPSKVIYKGNDTLYSIKAEKTASLAVGRVGSNDFWEDYIIIDHSNSRIDFREDIGLGGNSLRVVTGIIPEGKYTAKTLSVAVKNAMNKASEENGFRITYDVSYDENQKKFAIKTDGSSIPGKVSVQLMFETGGEPTVSNINTGVEAMVKIDQVLADAGTGVQAGDAISFVLTTDGKSENVSFTVDASDNTTRTNFLNALNNAITLMDNSDLSVDDGMLDATDNAATIIHKGGKNIWVDDLTLTDNAAGSFGGDYINNGFDYLAGTGDVVGFDIMLGGVSVVGVSVDVDAVGDLAVPGAITNTMIADEISKDFNSNAVMQNGESVVLQDTLGNSVAITRNGDNFDFATTNGKSFSIDNFSDDDASSVGTAVSLSITANNGTTLSSTNVAGTASISSGSIEVLNPVAEHLDSQAFDTGGGKQRLDATVTILNKDALTIATSRPFGSAPLILTSGGDTWNVFNNPGYEISDIITGSSTEVDLDLDGDGAADIRVSLASPVTGGNDFIEFDITSNLGESSIAPDMGFTSRDVIFITATSENEVTPINSIIIDNTNNKIEFQETDMAGVSSGPLMATIPNGSGANGEYTDPDILAAAIKTAMEAASFNNVTYDVTYNAEVSRFIIQNSGPTLRQLDIFWGSGTNADINAADALGFFETDDQMVIPVGDSDVTLFTIDSTNNTIDFEELTAGTTTSLSATITGGNYTSIADLATEIETQLEAASAAAPVPNSIDYSVSYNSTTRKFTIADNGGTLTDLRFLWNTGANSATSAATVLGYSNGADTAGSFGGNLLGNNWDHGDTVTIDFSISGTTLNYSHTVDTFTDTNESIMADMYDQLVTTFDAPSDFTLNEDMIDFQLANATLQISGFTDSGSGNASLEVTRDTGATLLPEPVGYTILAGDTVTFYSTDDDVTPGVTSWVGDNEVVLFTIDDTNRYIDFQEVDFSGISEEELTAIIPKGTYTSISDMALAIENALEEASTLATAVDDYAVSYDSVNRRFVIKYEGNDLSEFRLLWASGSNSVDNASQILGFDRNDDVMAVTAGDEYVVSIAVDDTNNKIDFKEILTDSVLSDIDELHAIIPNGIYTDFSSLAQAIENAMNGESSNFGNNITYDVDYDVLNKKFSIKEKGAKLDEVVLLWQTGENSTESAATILGFDMDDTSSPGVKSTREVEWGIFNTLFDLKTYLAKNDVAGLERSLGRLEKHFEHTKSLIADTGIKMGRIEVKQKINVDLKLSLTERGSNLEDADIIEAIMDLKTNELAYEASLKSSTRLMQLSLVNYL